MRKATVSVGVAAGVGTALTSLPQVLDAVPAEWGPAGPLIAAAGWFLWWLVEGLTTRVGEDLGQIRRELERHGEGLASLQAGQSEMRSFLWLERRPSSPAPKEDA